MYSEIPIIDIESIVQVDCVKVGKRSLVDLARRLISDFETEHAEDSETDGSNINYLVDEGLTAEYVEKGPDRTVRCFNKKLAVTEYN